MSINDQLDDEIIVSVIAADFEQETDFSKPMIFDNSSLHKDTTNEEENDDHHDDEGGNETPREKEELDKSNILPSFLKL